MDHEQRAQARRVAGYAERGLTACRVTNHFGQSFGVGSFIGFGHRHGNGSKQQVGVVKKITPYEGWSYNYETKMREPVTKHRVTALWLESTDDQSKPWTSTVEAAEVFALDSWTISQEIRARLYQ